MNKIWIVKFSDGSEKVWSGTPEEIKASVSAYQEETGTDIVDRKKISEEEFQRMRIERRGKAEKEVMDKNIVEARKAAMIEDDPDRAELGPYSLKASSETGDVSTLSQAADVLTLPGRYILKDKWSAGTDFSGMERLPEDYSTIQGKVLSSPVLPATVLASPFASLFGGAVAGAPVVANSPKLKWLLPAAAEAGTNANVAVGSGLAFDPEYGKGSAAFDVATSLAGPVIGEGLGAVNQAIKAKKMASKYGIASEDVAKQLASDVDPVSMKYTGIYDEKRAAKQVRDRAKGRIEKELTVAKIPNYMLEQVQSNIKTSVANPNKSGFKRTSKQALADLDRIEEMKKRMALLDEEVDPELFKAEMAEILTDYSDIPELTNIADDFLTESGYVTKFKKGEVFSAPSFPPPPSANPVLTDLSKYAILNKAANPPPFGQRASKFLDRGWRNSLFGIARNSPQVLESPTKFGLPVVAREAERDD